MDKKQQQSKSQGSGRLSSAEQAQLAMFQQLGIPLDPSMMAAYGLPPGMDAQQLLNPMAGGYPFMNPAALQAFTGLGALGGAQGSAGSEWWNLAQNQALAASLGAGYYPGMLPGFPMVPPNLAQDTKSSSESTSKAKDIKKERFDKISPRPDSRSSPSISRLQHQERKSSRESINSSIKDRPDSHHSASSPFRASSSKQIDSSSNAMSSWMDGINSHQQQKINEQLFQAELMRQLEQQFVLQQFQMQQQDQMTAAMQSLMGGNMPGTSSSSSKKGLSDAEKMQQQLASMMHQLVQPGGALQGMTPAMASSFLSAPGALETMLAMSQMGNLNAIQGLGNLQNLKQEDKKSPSSPSSQRNSLLHNPSSSKNQKYTSSSVPSSSLKKRERSSSPGKAQLDSNAKNFSAASNIPAGLSPDNTLLAMLYSQQLQYDELIKQQLEAVNKLKEEEDNSSQKESQNYLKHNVKQEPPRPSSRHNDFLAYNRTNLHSPANSTSSSRGKAHISPTREFSTKSPSRKSREPEWTQSHASSSKHASPRRKQTLSKDFSRGSMSETLKLFSTLASNPNLTQQELAALLSLPTADPTALLSGMGPQFQQGLLEPALSASQMTPSELEKLNKNLAVALDFERQRLEEQMKHQLLMESGSMKKGKDEDNHVSVIHQNNLKTNDFTDLPSSSRRLEEIVRGKRSFGESKHDTFRLGNGDAASSDGDVRSEASADRNSEKTAHKRRRVVSDDDEVMEPLKQDWKREVRFKQVGNQFRGEVVYIAPSGKKLRTYPDVLKHLEENKTTQLQKSNFSFSSRLRVGKYFEQKDKEDGGRQLVEMTEDELDQRIQQLDGRQTSSPFPDNSDQMSNYSSSSKGDSKPSKKDKDQEKEWQKEKLRLLKEHGELRILEQQRIEREIRERLALEELERQRVAEARQQMLLMRALESRKRAEERERRREEIRIEKMKEREKKMEQRRIAMQIARELRMPVEDMATIGAPEIPDLTRLQGTYDNKCPHQLSGNACADLLMVLEFMKTFKDCIRLDEALIPTFEKLQLGLLNDPMHTAALVQITMALLHQCLCDPGVPAPGPWLHCLTGVKVTDIDVRVDNYSEILRLFVWARSGFKTEIALRLETLPFPSLTADEKATTLAFLVNELVCSRPICMEIEKNLDNLATLRRDKWMVEGQIRQLRIAYEKNPAVDSPIFKMDDDDNSTSSFSSKPDQFKEEPPEGSNESLFQKKMEELTQQHSACNTQLAHSSKPLRSHDLGQDRYKRRYWVLPNLGGVYVEGLESGISYEDDDESPDEDSEDEEEELKKKEKKPNPENMEGGEKENQQETNRDKEAASNQESQNPNPIDEVPEPMEVTGSGVDKVLDGQSVDESDREHKAIDNLQSSDVTAPATVDSTQSENHAQSATTQTDLSKENGPNDTHHTSSKPHNKNSQAPELENSKSTMQNHDPVISTHTDTSTTTGTNGSENELNLPNSMHDPVTVPHIPVSDSSINSELVKSHDVSPSLNNSTLDKSPNSKEVSSSKNPPSPSHRVTPTKPREHTLMNEENDKVIAAAKAIAAKAVASSTHLLFPKGESTSPSKAKSKKETEVSPEKQKDTKSNNSDGGANNSMPIGEHTINALVQMGVNPTSLTHQQLEVLSHLDIPDSILPDMMNLGSIADSAKLMDQSSENPTSKKPPSSQSSKSHTNEEETHTVSWENGKKLDDQESPMDLSCPVPTLTLNQDQEDQSPVKFAQVKKENSERDSSFMPGRDSPDPKSIDNKYFVPISHSTSADVKMEQQQYNNVMSSCPSPNTLANYIVSSVNYGNFPALDDIKFPIRAPDVKEEPDAIPRDRKRGWWRIESESELRSLSEKLHLRGIREKQLHRNITKNFDICTNSMTVATVPEHRFVMLTKDSVAEKDQSESEEKLTDVEKVAKSVHSSSQERNFNIPLRFVTSENLAYEAEMQVLYQVEELSARCVNLGVVSPQWRNDNPKPSMARKDLTHVPLGPLRDETGIEIKFDALNPIHHDPKSVLGAAVDFLGCLERAVCRRYLKPPLVRKGGASEFSSLPSLSESGVMDVAAGLRTWRNAVASSGSASQLSLCIRMLESCIAWDRSANPSPTKVDTSPLPKTKKRKTDKRSTLKNPFEPDSPPPSKKRRKKRTNPNKTNSSLKKEGKKVKRMPIDTADVISKSGLPLTNGGICNDVTDNNSISGLNSFDDSLASTASNPEFSPQKNGPIETDLMGSPLSPQQYHTNSDAGNISEEYRPSSEPKKKKKKKKKMKSSSKDEDQPKKPRKPRKKADKDTVICRGVLRELQSHEDATWFLFPVDCKLVPGYRKIITKPIDFHTIESRLKRGRYKSKEEFVSEVRLVFDNCQKFNEDDSNIGRAGHQIRDFFERRWTEILREKYGETNPPSPQAVASPVDDLPINDIDQLDSIPEPEFEPVSESASYPDSESGLVIDDS